MDLIPNSKVSIKVIFEDAQIIIVDKPAGIPVVPIKPDEKDTLANGLAAIYPKAEFVHRLDNDTSGVIIAAKNKAAFEKLRMDFDAHKILKTYTALVLGETPDNGIIETPIIHDPKNKSKMKVDTKDPKAQDADTSYKVLKRTLDGHYCLLEITIGTGVRHQIRVHMASIGHPLAGDTLYQNPRQRKRDKLGLKRQFLHASSVGFHHPRTGKWVEFVSPLPEDLKKVQKCFLRL